MAHDHASHQTHAGPELNRAWFVSLLLIVFVVATMFLLAPKPKAPTTPPPPVPPRAVVTRVTTVAGSGDDLKAHQQVEAKYLDGPMAGKTVSLDIGQTDVATTRSFAKPNDVVYVGGVSAGDETTPYVQNFDRSRGIILLILTFAAITLIVSRARGLRALIGLGFSLLVVGLYMLPSLINGGNLVVTASIGSVLILAPTYLLSYGLTRKSAVALASTLGTLFVALLLGELFANIVHLTGLYDEDAVNFAIAQGKDGAFVFQLLIAGMLIGVLGVLDDVVIAQVSTVAELSDANRGLTRRELFQRAMRVGNDHIASVVNTLVLAYAGASLPVFLYLTTSHLPFALAVSDEALAAEIVRMLVGTIGLVLAVPLATLLASIAYRRK